MNIKSVKFLVGNENIQVFPMIPFHELTCNFLDDLSKVLFSNKDAVSFTDIATFAFWCRRANIVKLKNTCNLSEFRLGRGIVFHISPSNIPMNFAFSWAFGLLAGNGNIVRISSNDYPQTSIICNAINQTLMNGKYEILKNQNVMISYNRDDEITAKYSELCDARIIWGGDETVKAVRKISVASKTIDITFPDRYSLCIIDCSELSRISAENLLKLTNDFYNDTFLNDQNACSSPHLIIWLNETDENREIKGKFYQALLETASKYELADIKVSDKYNMLCNHIINLGESVLSVDFYGNLIYSVDLKRLPDDITVLRGKFGLFFNYSTATIEDLNCLINKKIQTIVYFGIDKQEIANLVIRKGFKGVDRIVHVGKSMDMGIIWDGYNLINELSRIVSFE